MGLVCRPNASGACDVSLAFKNMAKVGRLGRVACASHVCQLQQRLRPNFSLLRLLCDQTSPLQIGLDCDSAVDKR